MGWTGPAWGAGRGLTGAAGAPKHGLDALDAAYVRCVPHWTVPKSVPCSPSIGTNEAIGGLALGGGESRGLRLAM